MRFPKILTPDSIYGDFEAAKVQGLDMKVLGFLALGKRGAAWSPERRIAAYCELCHLKWAKAKAYDKYTLQPSPISD